MRILPDECVVYLEDEFGQETPSWAYHTNTRYTCLLCVFETNTENSIDYHIENVHRLILDNTIWDEPQWIQKQRVYRGPYKESL